MAIRHEQRRKPRAEYTKSGFTLIELSIVLVIIGLIVGGVLVGRDLIKVATDRRVIAQMEATNTAINTFRTKFNELPGDFDQAAVIWPSDNAQSGNGNGMIEESDGGVPNYLFEGSNLFHQLALAGLVQGQYNPIASVSDLSNSANNIAFLTALPNVYIHVKYQTFQTLSPNFPSDNYLMLHLGQPLTTTGFSFFVLLSDNLQKVPGLWPSDASFIDTKIDDGMPLTGHLFVMFDSAGSGDTINCADNSGANLYNTDDKAGWGNCGLMTKLQ